MIVQRCDKKGNQPKKCAMIAEMCATIAHFFGGMAES